MTSIMKHYCSYSQNTKISNFNFLSHESNKRKVILLTNKNKTFLNNF